MIDKNIPESLLARQLDCDNNLNNWKKGVGEHFVPVSMLAK